MMSASKFEFGFSLFLKHIRHPARISFSSIPYLAAMKTSIFITLLAAVCLIAPASAFSQPITATGTVGSLCSSSVMTLRTTLSVEPQVLAESAATAGDYRYLEWFGLVSVIPGIADQQCVRNGKFHKWFEGTSNALCSEEHQVLYERSYIYAEHYNRHMALLRKTQSLDPCAAP